MRDTGTPEALYRRIALVGPEGDLTRAHYPLGVALERGIIELEHHQAGLKYLRAFTVAVKRPIALGVPATMPEASDDVREELTLAWRAYSEALSRIGAKGLVDAIVLYQRFVPWLVSPRPSKRKAMLRDGLEAIARVKL